jgi:hypothetical protein
MKIRSSYIPKIKGLFYLARVGYSSGKESNYFNGKILAGYEFSPLISLGVGTGFAKNYSTFHYDHITTVSLTHNWGHEKMTSSGFAVPFLPVFINIRSSISKKRVVPYLSFDIGCSIPLIQKIDGEYTVSEDKGYPFPHTFHVDKINVGWYFGINSRTEMLPLQ